MLRLETSLKKMQRGGDAAAAEHDDESSRLRRGLEDLLRDTREEEARYRQERGLKRRSLLSSLWMKRMSTEDEEALRGFADRKKNIKNQMKDLR